MKVATRSGIYFCKPPPPHQSDWIHIHIQKITGIPRRMNGKGRVDLSFDVDPFSYLSSSLAALSNPFCQALDKMITWIHII